MNKENEFDRIAREKLAERSFTFQEGDWAAMEQLITQGRKRRGLGWWYTLAAVALIAPIAWYLLQEPATEAPALVQVPAAQPSDTANAPTQAPDRNNTTTSAERSTDTGHMAESSATPGSSPASASAQSAAVPEQQTSATGATTTQATTRPSPANTRTGNASLGTSPTIAQTAPPSSGAVPAEPHIQAASPNTSGTAVNVATAATTEANTAPLDNPPPVVQPDVPIAPGSEEPASTVAPSGGTEGTSGVTPVDAQSPLAPGNAPLAQDSTAPAPPTIVAKAVRPWALELTGLGGAWASAPRYSGTETDPWRNDVHSRLAPACGAEVALQRGWFGVGTGIHATTYSEAVQQERQQTSNTSVDTSYGLTPTPATITIIIDTIIQGPATYYVTQTIDTVLNVLTTEYDTTTTVTVLREGIDRVNRVSYVEVPLFLDLHTSAGRWTFGARGGPFVGFRTEQRTVLPGAEGANGNLADATFRSTVFGWSARVYARYRLTDRWSLGMEPGMRGSFGDVMDTPGIARRNSAWGAWLSLSYRLP